MNKMFLFLLNKRAATALCIFKIVNKYHVINILTNDVPLGKKNKGMHFAPTHPGFFMKNFKN